MRNQVAIRWARNPLLAVALLCAFFARALIPTGFMPGTGGLVICRGYAPGPEGPNGHGIVAMDMAVMDMAAMELPVTAMGSHAGNSTDGREAPNHEGTGICPFAASATAMASPQVGHAGVWVHFVSTAVEIPAQRFVAGGTIVPANRPRGPPPSA